MGPTKRDFELVTMSLGAVHRITVLTLKAKACLLSFSTAGSILDWMNILGKQKLDFHSYGISKLYELYYNYFVR